MLSSFSLPTSLKSNSCDIPDIFLPSGFLIRAKPFFLYGQCSGVPHSGFVIRSSSTDPILFHIDKSSSSKSAFLRLTVSRFPEVFLSSSDVSGSITSLPGSFVEVLNSDSSNVTAYPLTYPDVSLVFILYIPNSVSAPIITALVCSFKSLCCSVNLVFL